MLSVCELSALRLLKTLKEAAQGLDDLIKALVSNGVKTRFADGPSGGNEWPYYR